MVGTVGRGRVDPKEVSERLALAMELRRIGVRNLHELLEAHVEGLGSRPAVGTSYGTVRSYVNGETKKPRIRVLEQLAEILEVRSDWLLWGEGEITEEAERLRAASERRVPSKEESPEDFLRLRIMVAFPEFEFLDYDAQALVTNALSRFYAAAPRDWFNDDGELEDPDLFNLFLFSLRRAVLVPVYMWGGVIESDDPALRDYLRLALSTFILAIPHRIDRRPVWADLNLTTAKEGSDGKA